MAIRAWRSNERGVEVDTPFAACCGETPEVLHFRQGECYLIFCRRKGCLNERQGVLTYDVPEQAHAKWEQFRNHRDLR